jgi:Tol biopolymer transport system component
MCPERILMPLVLSILGATAGFAAGPLELVSRVDPSQYSATAAAGAITDFFPFTPASLSADGRYAVFVSAAANLVPGQKDVNGWPGDSGDDVFLADLVANTLTLVSHSEASPTTTGNLASSTAVISANGRYVAFLSTATDLAPGPAPLSESVMVYDRAAGTTTRVASSAYQQASFGDLAISADGRYLAFAGDGGDIVHGQQGDSREDVYLYDRVAAKNVLVSHVPGSPNTAASDHGASFGSRISADGRFVLFLTDSLGLLPGQLQRLSAVLYDRTTGALSLVGEADAAALSADGKTVAFGVDATLRLYNRETRVTTLVSPTAEVHPNNFNNIPAFSLSADGRYTAFLRTDPFSRSVVGVAVYDRVSLATSQVNPAAAAGGGSIDTPAISADGRFVAFGSTGTAWVAGQVDSPANGGNPGWDVFLYDRTAKKTTLLSHKAAAALATGNLPSNAPALSANGSRVLFSSGATDLVTGVADLNGSLDLFAWDASSKSVRALTLRAPALPSLSAAQADSRAAALSADGRYVAFESDSAHRVAGQVDANNQTDVFLYDSTTKTTLLVSRVRSSAVTAANGRSANPKISADGRYVAFYSTARNLIPGANPTGKPCLFLFDRTAGTVTFVARVGYPYDPRYEDRDPTSRLSPDGRWLAFSSSQPDLVPGQQAPFGNASNVFLWDRTTGGLVLVSHSAAGPAMEGDRDSFLPQVSADGRFVAFESYASDLIAGQAGESGNLFLWDRATGVTSLVSRPADFPTAGAGAGLSYAMSADGRFLAFTSGGDLDPGAPPSSQLGVYLYDRAQGTNQKIVSPDLREAGQVAISADGSQVALTSTDGQTTQIFLYDQVARSLTHVTHLPAAATYSQGDAKDPALSADGRYLAYSSDAMDLVAGQTEALGRNQSDVFLYDRVAGTTTLLSRWRGSAVTAAGGSYLPRISAGGRQIAFGSDVDLTNGDFNLRPDVFLFNLDGRNP